MGAGHRITAEDDVHAGRQCQSEGGDIIAIAFRHLGDVSVLVSCRLRHVAFKPCIMHDDVEIWIVVGPGRLHRRESCRIQLLSVLYSGASCCDGAPCGNPRLCMYDCAQPQVLSFTAGRDQDILPELSVAVCEQLDEVSSLCCQLSYLRNCHLWGRCVLCLDEAE